MMRFGLKLTRDNQLFLIDMETGEILAETPTGVNTWFDAYDGNYTLTLVE